MAQSLTGFPRPPLAELLARQRAEIASRIPGADALLAQGVLPALAEMMALAADAQHAHLAFIARQAMPLFAMGTDLDAWGALWDVTRKAATKAAGDVVFTGTDGAEIAIGAVLSRSDGVRYVVTAGGPVAGGSVTVTVAAAEAGTGGNAAAGVTLSLVSTVAGITSAGVVDADALTGGADTEADGAAGVQEAYRGRILARMQSPPHGGNGNDYVQWALEVPGVTRAWVYPEELGRGTVTVRFMMDDTYADGIPLAGDVAAVAAYIESHEDPLTGETIGRPIGAEVAVAAPVAVPLDITVADLSPDTAAVRAAIAADAADMLLRRAEPGKTIRRSWIWEAVSVATGEDGHEIASPAADVDHDTGEIATLGTITYS